MFFFKEMFMWQLVYPTMGWSRWAKKSVPMRNVMIPLFIRNMVWVVYVYGLHEWTITVNGTSPPPFQGENLKEYIPITWVRARHGKMFLTTPRLGQKKKIVGCTARFHQHIGVFINVLVWDPNGNKTLEVVWGDEGNCWIKGFSFEQHESLWSKKKIFFPFISCLGLWFVLVDSFFFTVSQTDYKLKSQLFMLN